MIGIQRCLIGDGAARDHNRPDDAGDLAARMIEEGPVAGPHGFQNVAGLVVADAIPFLSRILLRLQIGDGVVIRLAFEQEEVRGGIWLGCHLAS